MEPVRIDGHEFQPRDEIHRRQLEALRVFAQRLLASSARDQITKIVLFGSVARGQGNADSDVDVMVFGNAPLKRADDAVLDAAFTTQLELGVHIEPMLRTQSEFTQPTSDFLFRVLRDGKEVYSMDEPTWARQAAESFYNLALKYRAQAQRNYDPNDDGARRVAIDVAYNASELCAKGMLRLISEQLPKTHSGLNTFFSDQFVKTRQAPETLGRDFSVGLRYRNAARYDGDAVITAEMVQEVFRLADRMVTLLEQKLQEANGNNEQENHS